MAESSSTSIPPVTTPTTSSVSFLPAPLRAQSMGLHTRPTPAIQQTQVTQSTPATPATEIVPDMPQPPVVSSSQFDPYVCVAIDRNLGVVQLVRRDWTRTVQFHELRSTTLFEGTKNAMHPVTYGGRAVMSGVLTSGIRAKTLRYICKEELIKFRHVKDCTFDVDAERLAKSPAERMAENRRNADGLHRIYLSMYRPPAKETPAAKETPSVKTFMNTQPVSMKIRKSRAPRTVGVKESPVKETPAKETPIVPKRIDPSAPLVLPDPAAPPATPAVPTVTPVQEQATQPAEQPVDQATEHAEEIPSGLAVLIEAAKRMSSESAESSSGSSESGSSSGSDKSWSGSDKSESDKSGSDKSWSPTYLPANHVHPTQSGLRLSAGSTPGPTAAALTNLQNALKDIKVTGKAPMGSSLAIHMDRLTPRGQEMQRKRNAWASRRSYYKSVGRPFQDKEPYTINEIRSELLVLQPKNASPAANPQPAANPHRNVATSAKRTRPDAPADTSDEDDEMDESEDAPYKTRSRADMSETPLFKVGVDKPDWIKKAKK